MNEIGMIVILTILMFALAKSRNHKGDDKQMKVIDLLNKIANGQEVPKKIKWEDTIYAYSEYDKDYLEYPFSDGEYKGLFDMRDNILTQFLNDEVEILEEEQEKQERIDKAIEYIQNRIEDINNGGNEHDYRNLNEILNILQGSDKE